MNKNIKLIIKILVVLFIAFIMYIFIELYRFNDNTNMKPLIILGEKLTNVSDTYSVQDYLGLGYSIKYEYSKVSSPGSDAVILMPLKGEFKLFSKIPVVMWVQ